MNVRRASSTARRSGVMTRRTDTRSASRSTSPISSTPRTTPVTSAIASSSGSATSSTARENGRAALSAPRSCAGTTRSSHQRATSGSESSRRVSPVGAQSTTTTSNSSLSAWRRSRSRASSSSRPGGTVISSAEIRSAPRRRSCAESQSRTEAQLRSISACAWTCSAHSRSPDLRRLAADLDVEHVGQRVRGVGREDEGPRAGRRRAPRRRRRHRGLADAALPGVQHDARAHGEGRA